MWNTRMRALGYGGLRKHGRLPLRLLKLLARVLDAVILEIILQCADARFAWVWNVFG